VSRKPKTFAGEIADVENPEWEPLLGLLATDFMWMGAIDLEDGRRIHAYKHWWTRRYVHLDRDGVAFGYTGDGRYREVEPFWLLRQALMFHPDMMKPAWRLEVLAADEPWD
jgi:hypothetical protein